MCRYQWAQGGPEWDRAGEDIEWTKDVAVVIGVEMAAFLEAVDEVAHGIEVEDDFAGVLVETAHAHGQEGSSICWGSGWIL